jgi:hypothetical protein
MWKTNKNNPLNAGFCDPETLSDAIFSGSQGHDLQVFPKADFSSPETSQKQSFVVGKLYKNLFS